MKIAIIGLGSIGQRHLRNCLALRQELNFEEVRCHDLNKSRIEESLAKNPGAIGCETLEAAVTGADALLVCSSTSRHIESIEAASAFGNFHLFIEKPLAHVLAGCDDLIFRQRRSGKIVAVGYLLRHHPLLRRLKSLLEEGTLGRVLSARAESGFFLPLWHPWEDYRDFYMSWKTGGGGALLDTSHEINYLQWLLGEITEVKGYYGRVSDLEITSDDFATAIFRFANGAYGQFQLDLLQFDESRYCKIIGTEGVVQADLRTNELRWNLRTNHEWVTEKVAVDFDAIYLEEIREFVRACREGGECATTGEQALATLQIVEAVRRSSELGVAVRLPIY